MWTGCWRSLRLMVWTHLETLRVILWSAHSMITLRKWHVLSSIHVIPFWCLVVEISQSSCLTTARHQWRRHLGPLLWVLCGVYRQRMTLVLNNAFWRWCRLWLMLVPLTLCYPAQQFSVCVACTSLHWQLFQLLGRYE